MDYFLNLVASGLVFGSLYGLIAIGFAVIYKTTGVINFAQGEVMMFVLYFSWMVGTFVSAPLWALLLIAIVAGSLFGALIERLFVRPMIGKSHFPIIMTTVGVAIVLRGLVPIFWGVETSAIDAPIRGQLFQIGPVFLLGDQVFALVMFVLVSAGTWAFFRFSRLGAAMRAAAQDETAALLMGINVRRLQGLSWMIASAVSGVAGVCYALIIARAPDMWQLGLQAFPAAILGGLDAPIGAAFGAALVGIVASLSEGYIGYGLKEVSGFLIIIAVLMVRPNGLFGEKELERV